ncbi:hypothetical protein GCM10009087_44570 [Sphingomonas oligophenolica]|uniref:Uncharacterized protein n=1 Tax=Sphingomonas oligophenolica TaxID=301154 RepID=A0ABU9XZX9_9SPHN
MKHAFLLILSIFVLASPAYAKDETGVIAIRSAPIVLRPDQAYILLRIDQTQSSLAAVQPVFLRAPTDAEAARYLAAKQAAFTRDLPELIAENKKQGNAPPIIDQYAFNYEGPKNVFVVTKGTSLEGKGDFRTYLLELSPGDYIFYGSSAATLSSSASVLDTCNCLGTVGFHAEAGVITDLGTFLFDGVSRKSAIPELAAETGLGESYGNDVIGAAIRPATKDAIVPSAVTSLARKPAAYYAVGTFVEPGTDNINRLAPIPGILHYSNGRVVDDATGSILP